MDDLIFFFLNSILISTIIYFVTKKSNIELEYSANDTLKLRMIKFYFYFGVFLSLLGIFAATMFIINESGFMASFIILLFFGSIGGLSILIYKNHRVIIYSDKIEVYNFLVKPKKIYWSELKESKFNFFTGTLILINNNNEKTHILQHIVGFKSIIEKIKQNT